MATVTELLNVLLYQFPDPTRLPYSPAKQCPPDSLKEAVAVFPCFMQLIDFIKNELSVCLAVLTFLLNFL